MATVKPSKIEENEENVKASSTIASKFHDSMVKILISKYKLQQDSKGMWIIGNYRIPGNPSMEYHKSTSKYVSKDGDWVLVFYFKAKHKGANGYIKKYFKINIYDKGIVVVEEVNGKKVKIGDFDRFNLYETDKPLAPQEESEESKENQKSE